MQKGHKTAVYDQELKIEACRFQGLLQPFPNHFHEYYVIGLVEKGRRRLWCRNRESALEPGDLVLFQPKDCHACRPGDSGAWDYRSLGIAPAVMRELSERISGRRELPGFKEAVVRAGEISGCFLDLHERILKKASGAEKKEALLDLLKLLLRNCGEPLGTGEQGERPEIGRACEFIEKNYERHLSLEQICRQAGLGKSALLRAFAREKGITPYSYLENVRLGAAKRLLEQGTALQEAALRTGFFDQSHFTNVFRRYMGLAPGTYRDMFATEKSAGLPGKREKKETENNGNK